MSSEPPVRVADGDTDDGLGPAPVPSVAVHWGTVGPADEPPRTPSPEPATGRRHRLWAVLAAVVAVVVVGAAGGLVLVEEDDGARVVAQDYVEAFQRLDCDRLASLTPDPRSGGTQCRFLRFRAERSPDRAEVRRELREARFELVSLTEDARSAEAVYEVEWGGQTRGARLDLRRDEDALWRVLSFYFDRRR